MLKEEAVEWYLKNIEMPRKEIQDHPGFMGENLGDKDVYLRDIAIPEEVFIEIEDRIDEPEMFYKIGKKFGYRYAKMSGLDRYSDVNESDLKESTFGAMKYLESVCYWAQGHVKIDYDNKA
ncbi:MAG: hypothetical protein J07AB43_05870, partial [Candidatus Nanosalina sp. J07AB43]